MLSDPSVKNQSAAELFPVVYDELRGLAANLLNRHANGQTLQPTALVHEVFVKLAGSADPTSWENRQHFYAAAARAMRWILVDGQRRKSAFQRLVANGRIGTPDQSSDPPLVDLIALDDALNRLGKENPSAAQLVELRYFAGLTLDEAAKTMGISRRTVIDKWSFARTCLQVMLEGGPKH